MATAMKFFSCRSSEFCRASSDRELLRRFTLFYSYCPAPADPWKAGRPPSGCLGVPYFSTLPAVLSLLISNGFSANPRKSVDIEDICSFGLTFFPESLQGKLELIDNAMKLRHQKLGAQVP